MPDNTSSATSSDKCKGLLVAFKDDLKNVLAMCREHGIEPIFTNDIRKALPAVSKQASEFYNVFFLLIEGSGRNQVTVYVRTLPLATE